MSLAALASYTVLFIILGLILLVVFYVISIQRRLVRLSELLKNALGQIAVQVNSRWDALTQLAKTTKSYARHEHDTLMDVVAARRAQVSASSDLQEIQAQDAQAHSVLDRLFALAENYPDLKANQVYQELMASVNTYENNVRIQRMVYNDAATRYNNLVQMFPSSLIARMLGYATKDYFQEETGKSSMPDLDI